MSKSCIICGGDETEGELLVEAPCGAHWVCADDIASFFERATANESLFPPKCCGQMFMLQEYEDYIPFETAWAYQVKEQGEYAVLAKFRVYCANPPCAKFLHPSSHVEDPETKITYAICESEDCGKLTCCSCKTLLEHGTQGHTCQQDEDAKKFREIVTEKGYQECSVCGATVELAEACNHITCECGHDFCYICGKDWSGLHGCPHYGPATYDEEGYNQDGFHRDTGLNREGLTRRQDIARARGEVDPEEEDEIEDDGEDDDPDWDVLQHLAPEQRVAINVLQGEAREDALDQHRIELMETQGITFNQGQPQPQPDDDDEEEEDAEEGADDDGEDDDGNADGDNGEEDEDEDEAETEGASFDFVRIIPDFDNDEDPSMQWHGADTDESDDHDLPALLPVDDQPEDNAVDPTPVLDEDTGARFDQLQDDLISLLAEADDAADWPANALPGQTDQAAHEVDDDETAEGRSRRSSIESETVDVGADVDDRLPEDFADEHQEHAERPEADHRASWSSEDDEVRPATPMDVDAPAEQAVQEAKEVRHPLQVVQAPPGAWVDGEKL